MRIVFGLLGLLLVLAASLCQGKTVEVVGFGECTDCAENNLETRQAFSGLSVTIECKTENGLLETRGKGKLDEEGKFRVSVPEKLVQDGKLKSECYAQLHSASSVPCPAQQSLDSSKLVLNKGESETHRLEPKGKLKFSPLTCASAFFWPHYKHLPPLKGFGHHHTFPFPPIYKKPLPPFPFLPPPVPVYEKPLPPPVPVYEPPPVPVYKPLPPPVPVYKPLPPPVPVYKPPPVPVYKPLPPPVPVYKPPPVPVYNKPLPPPVPVYKKPCPPKPLPPPVPVYKKPCPPKMPKPLPPPVPVYKKPLPPPVPVYKEPLPPPVPVYKKPLPPPVPVYKEPLPPPTPVYTKPLPPPVPVYKPFPPKHPFFKPLPPLPKFPPFPKKPCPPLPKIPPKYFHHPKFGKFPPLAPLHPHSN